MLVVADSSPFIGLIKIGQVEVLPKLFDTIAVPAVVVSELQSPKRPEAVRQFIASSPPWLSIHQPSSIEEIEGLDAGETAAIAPALELKAELLLIDEARGRQAAIQREIQTVRTAAVIFEAAKAGFIPDLRTAFEKLKATDFRVPKQALDELLRRYEQTKTP